MTKKDQLKYEAKIKQLLSDLSFSNKLKVIERLGKEFRLANNLEIKKENDEFSSKLKRSV